MPRGRDRQSRIPTALTPWGRLALPDHAPSLIDQLTRLFFSPLAEAQARYLTSKLGESTQLMTDAKETPANTSISTENAWWVTPALSAHF